MLEFLIATHRAYCSSTLAGNTRKYHGLFVRDRQVLLAGLDEKVNGIQLSAQQYRNAANESGLAYLAAFSAYPPTWTYWIGDCILKKTITFDGDLVIGYDITGEVDLWVRPLVTDRTIDGVMKNPAPTIVQGTDGFRWSGLNFNGNLSYRVDPVAYLNVWYQREFERGYEPEEDLCSPGVFAGRVRDTTVTFRCTGTTNRLSQPPRPPVQKEIFGWLDWAAAAFCQEDEIFAGYHWFCESWGRDCAISIPGLLIERGKKDEVCAVLRRLAGQRNDGLIPNRVPDNYHSSDASLWFVYALGRYRRRWGEDTFIEEMKPVIENILMEYPTSPVASLDRNLITVTPGSTWMDTAFTPRNGKPVEVNALWIHSLDEAEDLGIPVPTSPVSARREFQRFWNKETGCLSDLIDPEDHSIRPNQVIAIALGMTGQDQAKAALETISHKLLTPYGLRSLSPDDPKYLGHYDGDASYHNGCVWPWLTGFYCEALLKNGISRQQVASLLVPIMHHAREAGIGYISEIFDGNAPFFPRGCVAQAWSVAEIARAFRMSGEAIDSVTLTKD
jgi:glycogen debranching enzyme